MNINKLEELQGMSKKELVAVAEGIGLKVRNMSKEHARMTIEKHFKFIELNRMMSMRS